MGKRIIKAVAVAILFVGVAVIGVLIHETGHAVMAEWQGGEFDYIAVYPGWIIYPFDRIESVASAGPVIAWARYYPLENWTQTQDGLVDLAGSLSTTLVSILSLLVLLVFKPKGLTRLTLVAFSCLLFIDLLRYSSVPLIGPHASLQKPGTGQAASCVGAAEPAHHPKGYAVPDQITQPELFFAQLVCYQDQPTIHFRLEGSQWTKACDSDFCFPVFFEIDGPKGRTWAVAEYDSESDGAQHFVHKLKGEVSGEYKITSAWTIYNGLRGMIIWGAAYPEPLIGAVRTGMNPTFYLSLVFLLTLVQAVMLLRVLRKS